MPIVTLLTDFGSADSLVGDVKAVLLSQSALATLVAIAHHGPPGNARAAAYLFERSWKHFPPGTVHLVVVDPDVGTERAALVLGMQDHFFVGPDNGVFSSILAQPAVLATTLPIPKDASPTFHGRHVVGPAAATLANRGWWPELATRLTLPAVRTELRTPERDRQGWGGDVGYLDPVGKLVTHLQPQHLSPGFVVTGRDAAIAT